MHAAVERVAHDEHVARQDVVSVVAHDRGHRRGHRAEVAGQRESLRHQLAFGIREPGRVVHVVLQHAGIGGAEDRERHLVRDREDGVLEQLEFDRIHAVIIFPRGYQLTSYFPRSIIAASSVARFLAWFAQRLLSISRAAFSQSPALIEAMVFLNRRKRGSPRLNTIFRTTSFRTGSRPGSHGNARFTSRRTVAMSLSRSINASARVIPASSRFRPTPIVSLRLASR